MAATNPYASGKAVIPYNPELAPHQLFPSIKSAIERTSPAPCSTASTSTSKSRVDYDKLASDRLGEHSVDIRARVQAARQRQLDRFKGTDIVCNADMRIAELHMFYKLDETGDSLIRAAMSQLNLSARAYHRILKLARIIADLACNEHIQTPHLAEALQYRPKGMLSSM